MLKCEIGRLVLCGLITSSRLEDSVITLGRSTAYRGVRPRQHGIANPNTQRSGRRTARPSAQMTSGRKFASSVENLVGRRISHGHGEDQKGTRNDRRATDRNIEVPATNSDGKTNHEANDESHTATPF